MSLLQGKDLCWKCRECSILITCGPIVILSFWLILSCFYHHVVIVAPFFSPATIGIQIHALLLTHLRPALPISWGLILAIYNYGRYSRARTRLREKGNQVCSRHKDLSWIVSACFRLQSTFAFLQKTILAGDHFAYIIRRKWAYGFQTQIHFTYGPYVQRAVWPGWAGWMLSMPGQFRYSSDIQAIFSSKTMTLNHPNFLLPFFLFFSP